MKARYIIFFLLSHAAAGHAQALPDSTAIKQVLAREAATWRAGDVAGHAQCWQLRPYSRIVVSTGDGRVLDVPPQAMLTPPPGSMGKGGRAEQLHFRFGIRGDAAWVSHDEISTARDGAKSYSTEFRMLEKVGGQWKLVGQSIHLAKQP